MTRDEYYADAKAREDKLIEVMTSPENVDRLMKTLNKATRLDLFYTVKVRELRGGEKCLEIESTEIQNPIIALAWKSFKITNFGGRLWAKSNKPDHYGHEDDFSKPSPEVCFSCPIEFDYRHIDGGTNGAHIGYLSFTESEPVWRFELYKDSEN